MINYFEKAKSFLSNITPFASKKEKHASQDESCEKSLLGSIDDFVWIDVEELNKEEAQQRAEYTESLSQFAFIETLAHSEAGAYGAPTREKNTIVSIKDPNNGEIIDYNVTPIKTKSTGLVAEIFTPVDSSKSNQLCINWAGTHSLGTALADLEKTPGEKSFRNEEFSILEQINNTVGHFATQSNNKVNVMITGHSLGGSLAQQCFHSMQRALATNIFQEQLENGNLDDAAIWIKSEQAYREDLGSKRANMLKEIPNDIRSNLRSENIASLSIGTWNSAGVLKAVETNSNTLAGYISKAGINLKGLFGMVGGDAVQTTGQGNILSNVAPEEANIQVLKVDKNQEGYLGKVFLSVAGAAIGSSIGLAGAAISAPVMLLLAPISILGGVSLAMLPMAKTTALAHTSRHFSSEEDKAAMKCELYSNTTPENRKIIQDKLTNKSALLQNTVLRAAQRGMYKALNLFINTEDSSVKKVEEDILTPRYTAIKT